MCYRAFIGRAAMTARDLARPAFILALAILIAAPGAMRAERMIEPTARPAERIGRDARTGPPDALSARTEPSKEAPSARPEPTQAQTRPPGALGAPEAGSALSQERAAGQEGEKQGGQSATTAEAAGVKLLDDPKFEYSRSGHGIVSAVARNDLDRIVGDLVMTVDIYGEENTLVEQVTISTPEKLYPGEQVRISQPIETAPDRITRRDYGLSWVEYETFKVNLDKDGAVESREKIRPDRSNALESGR